MATTEERNAELMQTLDDVWNAEDEDVPRARHKPDVVVRWPGQPEPTRGIEDHTTEPEWFWTAFLDQHLDNRPYRIFFASGNYTCSVAHFTGTMTGPLNTWAGDEIQPTGQVVRGRRLHRCTVGRRADRGGEPDVRPRDLHARARAERLIAGAIDEPLTRPTAGCGMAGRYSRLCRLC
jgi:hypothetical protein